MPKRTQAWHARKFDLSKKLVLVEFILQGPREDTGDSKKLTFVLAGRTVVLQAFVWGRDHVQSDAPTTTMVSCCGMFAFAAKRDMSFTWPGTCFFHDLPGKPGIGTPLAAYKGFGRRKLPQIPDRILICNEEGCPSLLAIGRVIACSSSFFLPTYQNVTGQPTNVR